MDFSRAAKRRGELVVYGSALLLLATALWGSSFVFIKLAVESLSVFSYTFYRSLISIAILTPIVIVKAVRRKIDSAGLGKGFITGVAYMLGLLLQGAGAMYTTPSVNAFITGLNTVHVHLYSGFIERKYSVFHLASLALAVAGLYIITRPSQSLGLGEALVFLGSIAWASQIILVSRYSREGVNSVEFLYGMLIPGLAISPYTILVERVWYLEAKHFLYVAYLAIVCTIGAISLQVIGQRYVSATTAATIYILEPLFAALFSVFVYCERLEREVLVGGGLMVLASFIAIRCETPNRS